MMRRSTRIAAVLFLVAEGVFAWGLWRVFASETGQSLALARSELELGYRGAIEGKAELIGAILRQAVSVPAVTGLLSQASGEDARGRQQARESLRRLLAPSFRILEGRDIRELRLILPDRTLLLGLGGRPGKPGDAGAAEQALIAATIETREPHRGFEGSPDSPAFHFAYPLIVSGALVGVADFALPLSAIRELLGRTVLDPGAYSRVLRAGDLSQPSRESGTDQDAPAASPAANTRAARPVPGWLATVDQRFAADPALAAAMRAGNAYGTHICLGSAGCYAATAMPLRDSLGRPSAALVAYTVDPAYSARRDRLALIFVLGSLLILAAGAASRQWLVSRQRLKTVTESMAEGLYVVGRDGRILFANPAAVALLGYPREDLIGRDARRLFHLECSAMAAVGGHCAGAELLVDDGVRRDGDARFRRRDGSPIRVSVVCSPLREEGEVVGSIVLFRDVTGELETRERLERADVAFRNLAEGVLVTDAEMRIIAVNPAFSQITGYAESEVLGQTPSLLASGRHDAAFYEDMWRRIAETDAWEGEIWNRRKDGETYPEWLRINTIRRDSGELLGHVAVFSDITELRANEERLRSLSYQDQLTGLYNRASFVDLCDHALIRCRGRGTRLALLYLDIDRFKRINDNLGHVQGDALLEALAPRLRACLRPQDEAARLGGDEFAVLLEDLDSRAMVARTAHEILARMREPILLDGRPVYLSASMGISVFPDDGADTQTLMKNADAAMYLAKQQGRDGYRYFSAAMASEVEQRFELESELRQALELGQLRLYYQPQVDLSNGFVIALEALVRWEHPVDGVREPGAFLDVARDAGLMPQLTEWTLREACRHCGQWRRMGLPFGRIAFNLDAVSVPPAELEPLLMSVVRDAGIAPQDLELEILETAMHPADVDKGLWERLVTLGFELAIDDFGTGESSLARLKRLPVRTLKIDRGFVREIQHQEHDRAIVSTVIAMTRTMGKRALAEGVESEAQLRFLINAGCDAVQGYIFSPPLPAEQIPTLLRSGRLRRRLTDVRPLHGLPARRVDGWNGAER